MKFFFQALFFLVERSKLLVSHLRHFLVSTLRELLRLLDLGYDFLVFSIGVHNLSKVRTLLREFLKLILASDDFRICQPIGEIFVPPLDVVQTREQANLLGRGFQSLSVLLAEPIDPSGGIHQLLRSSEQGVTFRADFHPDVLLRGTRVDDVSAGTGDRRFNVFRVNFLSHTRFLPTPNGCAF